MTVNIIISYDTLFTGDFGFTGIIWFHVESLYLYTKNAFKMLIIFFVKFPLVQLNNSKYNPQGITWNDVFTRRKMNNPLCVMLQGIVLIHGN